MGHTVHLQKLAFERIFIEAEKHECPNVLPNTDPYGVYRTINVYKITLTTTALKFLVPMVCMTRLYLLPVQRFLCTCTRACVATSATNSEAFADMRAHVCTYRLIQNRRTLKRWSDWTCLAIGSQSQKLSQASPTVSNELKRTSSPDLDSDKKIRNNEQEKKRLSCTSSAFATSRLGKWFVSGEGNSIKGTCPRIRVRMDCQTFAW